MFALSLAHLTAAIPLRTLAIGFEPSITQLVVLMVVMLILFGRRLPEVGRNLGKGLVEFKKGLHGIGDEMDKAAREEQPRETQYRSSLPEPEQQRRVSRSDHVEDEPVPERRPETHS